MTHAASFGRLPVPTIVPARKSHLLDQTLIYTSVTRGVLVGDRKALEAAIIGLASRPLAVHGSRGSGRVAP